MSPVINDKISETIPASIVIARAGLPTISSAMLLPAGTDVYNKFANDPPMKNNTGIMAISPTDHFPNVVFGKCNVGGVLLTVLKSISNSYFSSAFSTKIHFSSAEGSSKYFLKPTYIS